MLQNIYIKCVEKEAYGPIEKLSEKITKIKKTDLRNQRF